jgi:hypothetical protein
MSLLQETEPALENKKNNKSTQTSKGKSGKEFFLVGPRTNFFPKEVTLTSRRNCRISQHPSDWWNVKSDESSGDGNSSQENDSSVVYPNRKKNRLREIMYLRGLGRNLVHQKDRRQT